MLSRVQANLSKVASLAQGDVRGMAEKALVRLKALSFKGLKGRENEIALLRGADEVHRVFFVACTSTEVPGQGARTGVMSFVGGGNSRRDLVLAALGAIYQLAAVRAVGAHLLPSLLVSCRIQ